MRILHRIDTCVCIHIYIYIYIYTYIYIYIYIYTYTYTYTYLYIYIHSICEKTNHSTCVSLKTMELHQRMEWWRGCSPFLSPGKLGYDHGFLVLGGRDLCVYTHIHIHMHIYIYMCGDPWPWWDWWFIYVYICIYEVIDIWYLCGMVKLLMA